MQKLQFYSATQLPEDLANALQKLILFLYVEDAEKMTVPVQGGILTIELAKDGSE